MRKLICDKCGREIDAGFDYFVEMEPTSKITIPNGTNDELHFDLCKNCTNSLVEWLKNKA